jgi:hypothetical protein
MPIYVFWDSPEQTIVRQDLNGRWTSQEYVQSVMDMYAMMRTVPHLVHIVVDMTRTEDYPTLMIAFASRFNTQLPSNRGLTVGINIPAYLVSIVHIATRMYPRLGRNVHFTTTLESAYDIVQQYGDHLR